MAARLTVPEQPLAESRGIKQSFITILRRFGVDRAISYTVLGRGWSTLAGPLTIMLIGHLLRPEEQGFYYTFGSLIALNVFFELGLTYVLLQFSSHEKAHLEWTGEGTLEGSEVARMRLAALLKIALKWYGTAAALVVAIVLPAGLLFFSRNTTPSAPVIWRAPWICLATASALNLFVSPFFAILEGCGKISHIASMRVGQSILANIGLWVALLCRGGLFAVPVFQTLTLAFGLVWLGLYYRVFFGNLLETPTADAPFNWLREVWPFQWRIALSWLSGYFIFQLFNPVLFATRGPIVAGQMGMSLSLCSALLNLSISWMSTKASPFGVLVAKRQWKTLDTQFFRTLWQSLLVLVAAGGVLYVCVLVLNRTGHPFSRRLLNPLPFALLLLSTVMNHVVFCEAQYLRTHKAEPFLRLSIVGGLLTCASIYVLAKPFGSTGVSAGYLVCCSISLLWGTLIFIKRRREWHV